MHKPSKTSPETAHQPQGPARPGMSADASDPAAFDRALDLAVDYRGDVTIIRREGEPIEGYLYDRRRHDDPARAAVRLLPADGGRRVTIPLVEIERIEFTGRDPASGKSFDTWMKKYVEKKLAGQEASIQSDSLDE